MKYGNEERAIRLVEEGYKKCMEAGKKKPSEMCPASRVQLLVGEIKEKISRFQQDIGQTF